MEVYKALNGLDYGVIVAYIISVIVLGFWVSYKRRGSDDIFLAGRTLGWPNIGLSIWGTNISPSMMIASCGVAYSSGIVMGNSSWLAWVALVLMAMVFIPHYLNTKIFTMPEFMSIRYGKGCRDFLSWYTLVSTLLLWLGGTTLAGGVLMSQIIGWPVWLCIVVLMIIATSFTVAGGLAAVVATDSYQVVLMIVASTILTIVAVVKVGGLGELTSSVPGHYWNLFKPASDPDWPWPAVVFGYFTAAIWFWCTDQTVVQRALGAKSIEQGQLGIVFTGFLKILDPLIFFIPGIACFLLFPNLEDPDQAYMKMVTTCLPHGMIGLIIAVLIAALVSTVDSGLNSLSTVFTLDIYKRMFHPDAGQKTVTRVGRIATIIAACVSVGLSVILSFVEMNLFELLGSIIGFLAPTMSVVFLLGVAWKRATSTAAFWTLVVGSTVSAVIGVMYLIHWPSKEFWPHFMMLSFYIFLGVLALMVFLSLVTSHGREEKVLPTIKETYQETGYKSGRVWVAWGILAVVMVALYLIFNFH